MSARILALLLAATIAFTPIVAAAPPVSIQPPDPELARIRREVEGLRSEHRLAARKEFYLRLDARRQSLVLLFQGVRLHEYAAHGLAWGVPEVVFVDRNPAADWDAAAFSKGRLEPERERDRLQFVANPPAGAINHSGGVSPPPASLPKSAEESYSVPSPYRIVFAEGVSLEVRVKGEGGRNRSVFRRLSDAVGLRISDFGAAIGLGAAERVRLRVTLDAEDAASLYRSLPPDVGLVVVGLPVR